MSTLPEQDQPAPEPAKTQSVVRSTPMANGLMFQPRSFGELMEWAKLVAGSGMVPKAYINNPGAVLVAVQMGAEVGLSPMAALQNIAVINGRPSVWGDAGLAIVKTHPDFVKIVETQGEGWAKCVISRRGQPDVEHTFTLEDAKKALLLGKEGPWQTAPRRMAQMRARWFAMRDQFPDALRGISSAEESQDIVEPQNKPQGERPKSLDDVVVRERAKESAAALPAPTVVPAQAAPPRSLNDVVAQSKAQPRNEPPHPAASSAGF